MAATSPPPESKLKQMFEACDSKGTGYIGRDDLREICANLGIASNDSDTLFTDLDRDQDGRIDFSDFATGFRECCVSREQGTTTEPELITLDAHHHHADAGLTEDLRPNTAEKEINSSDPVLCGDSSASKKMKRRSVPELFLRRKEKEMHQKLQQTPKRLEELLDELGKISDNQKCSMKLDDMQTLMQAISSTPQMADCFEEVMMTLFQDIKRLHENNQRLEEVYKTEKEKHDRHLRQIEEEIDVHVSKVEAKIKEQMREEAEAEKRALKAKMETEMNELQSHLKMFQTFETLLKKDHREDEHVNKMKNKLEEATYENRRLRMTLSETQTNIALLQSEMAHLRAQYEEKCRELHSERESAYEYIYDQDHLSRQLHLLHEANKKLQDVNDSIRVAMKASSNNNNNSPQSPSKANSLPRCLPKRGSIIGDYLQEDQSTNTRNLPELNFNQRLRTSTFPLNEMEADSQYESMNDRSPRVVSPSQIAQNKPGLQDEFSFGMKRFMEDLDSGLVPETAPCNRLSKASDDCLCENSMQHNINGSDRYKNLQDLDEYEEVDLSDSHSEGWAVLPVPQTLTATKGASYPRNSIAGLGYHGASRPSLVKKQGMVSDRSFQQVAGPPDRIYKVVFAGDAAVGKTTFIFRIGRGAFLPTVTSTLGVDFHVKTIRVDEKNVTLQLWDTAGQERFRSVTKSYFRRADGVMLLYDCTSEHSFLNVREWMEAIDEVAEKRVPVMLCANKIDLRETAILQGKSIVRTDDGERLARDFSAIFIETSVKSGKNVLDALIQLTREMSSNEDWEVQTSGLRITNIPLSKRSSSCCKK